MHVHVNKADGSLLAFTGLDEAPYFQSSGKELLDGLTLST